MALTLGRFHQLKIKGAKMTEPSRDNIQFVMGNQVVSQAGTVITVNGSQVTVVKGGVVFQFCASPEHMQQILDAIVKKIAGV